MEIFRKTKNIIITCFLDKLKTSINLKKYEEYNLFAFPNKETKYMKPENIKKQ